MAKIKIKEGSPLEIILEKDNGEQIILHRGEVGFQVKDFRLEAMHHKEAVISIGKS